MRGPVIASILVLAAALNARQRAEEIGAVGYLAKSFDLAELVARVKHLARLTSRTDNTPHDILVSDVTGESVKAGPCEPLSSKNSPDFFLRL